MSWRWGSITSTKYWMKGEEAEVRAVGNKRRLSPRSVVTHRESLSCAWLESGLFQIHLLSALLLSVYIFEYICTLFLSVNRTDLWMLCYFQSDLLTKGWLCQTLGLPLIAVAFSIAAKQINHKALKQSSNKKCSCVSLNPSFITFLFAALFSPFIHSLLVGMWYMDFILFIIFF